MTATPAELYIPLHDAGGVKVVVRASRGKEDWIGDEYIDVLVVVMMGTTCLDTEYCWSLMVAHRRKSQRARGRLKA